MKPKHDESTHGKDAIGWVFLYGESTADADLPDGVAWEIVPIGIRWADGCEELFK